MLGNYLQKKSVNSTKNINYIDFREIFNEIFDDSDIINFIRELNKENLLMYKFNVYCPVCDEVHTVYEDSEPIVCENCGAAIEMPDKVNLFSYIYVIDKIEYMQYLEDNKITLKAENKTMYNKKAEKIISIGESSNHSELSKEELCNKVTIGVITALPKECAAMKLMLKNVQAVFFEGDGAGHTFYIGELLSANSKKHLIALGQCNEMGNNNASIRVMSMKNHFHKLDSIIMTGIAGGIPNPKSVENHVRLGDIVVSTKVTQYDLVKDDGTTQSNRSNAAKPSAKLIEAINRLQTKEYESDISWYNYIDEATGNNVKFKKPDLSEDKLYDEKDEVIEHPKDNNRTQYPKVFYGDIASANVLLKNRERRDLLRDKYKAKAVEMEASGIADASYNNDVGYIIVRGICDYCDNHKNDVWQEYAAIVAAAYTRSLIEELPSFVE